MSATLLKCTDLCVRFAVKDGCVHAVENLTFEIHRGECVGIVGESGSGKTQSVLAIMGLLPRNGTSTGNVVYKGQSILNASRQVMNKIRGESMCMIFQDAMAGLTPFMQIGDQLCEVLIEHQGLNRADARDRAIEVLEIVQFPQPKRRFSMYPHELSGGMRQRIMIALALLCRPQLIFADEPTTALDITIQAQILEFMKGLQKHIETSIVMITHDLGVAANLCDRIIVMYAGRMVESGSVKDIFFRPQHPYTQALLRATPRLDADPDEDIPLISGRPPNLQELPVGCAFTERCDQAQKRCMAERPELSQKFDDHLAACFVEQTK
ncbi:MAG TPA: ABC transporter ATP-binding protein [Gammaproteobacteria bacterium]|jgi:oligopeptide transport system ATP-binding protein|nr:ABC transporter ATP-binding protein [Gammaproteobacteria bacterium]